MLIWVDLFTFQKVVYLPAWAKILPAPLMAPAYLAFVCLIPAAFVANTLKGSILTVTKSVLLSPLTAIAAFALNPAHQDGSLTVNVLFNYVWIVLFHCLLPALLLVGARAVLHYALKYKHR
jgi:hypothetical protein